MRHGLAALVVVAALAATAAAERSIRFDRGDAADGPDLDPFVRGVLAHHLKFSSNEFADLQRERIVGHTLDARAAAEFGVAGAVRVRSTKEAFIAAARDIEHFKNDPGVLQIGRIGVPPSIDDLARLTVDEDDFDPASCRVHDCGVRLPADMIARARQEIDLRATDAREQAARWFKRAIIADVGTYIAGGPGRFVQYDDGDAPIRPLEDFAEVLAHSPAIGALAPGLPEHLANFPANGLAGADDFFYWSKEKFGVAPFISVTQVTIVCPSTRTCVMTTKDVYSTRYINASLAVAIASDASGGGFYLVYANRSRASALKGGLSALRRSIVERRARAALEDNLRAIKMRLENGR